MVVMQAVFLSVLLCATTASFVQHNFVRRAVCCTFYLQIACSESQVISSRSLIHALSLCTHNISCAGILKGPLGQFYYYEPHRHVISENRCATFNLVYFLYTRREDRQGDVTPTEDVTSTSNLSWLTSAPGSTQSLSPTTKAASDVLTVDNTLKLGLPVIGSTETNFLRNSSCPALDVTSPNAAPTTENNINIFISVNTSNNLNPTWPPTSAINGVTELFSPSQIGDSQLVPITSSPQGNPDEGTPTIRFPIPEVSAMFNITPNVTSNILQNVVTPVAGLNGSVSQPSGTMNP